MPTSRPRPSRRSDRRRRLRSPGPAAADAAVSAPLGTALVIAIVIALSVAVFFFVRIIGKPSEEGSSIGMQIDEGHDTLTYVQSSKPIDLSHVRMTLSVPGHYGFNAPASPSSPAIGPSGVMLSSTPGQDFRAGDVIAFCADAYAEHATVQLVQDDDKLLLQRTFDTLAAC